MSRGSEILQNKPDNFPECESCRHVSGLIERWTNYVPTFKHQSVKPRKISVHCSVEGFSGFIGANFTHQIQFVKNGPELDIDGDDPDESVECPHFVPEE